MSILYNLLETGTMHRKFVILLRTVRVQELDWDWGGARWLNASFLVFVLEEYIDISLGVVQPVPVRMSTYFLQTAHHGVGRAFLGLSEMSFEGKPCDAIRDRSEGLGCDEDMHIRGKGQRNTCATPNALGLALRAQEFCKELEHA